MAKHYQRTWHLKVDIERVKKIIEKNKEKFFCPFSNENSYLNIYKGTECDVKFLNLQHCDYSRAPNAAGKKYIRYLMMLEHKAGRKEKQEFLKEHYDKFTVETNEENFCVPDEDKDIQHKLFTLLGEIFTNKLILRKISKNQSQNSDKNVYNNITKALKKIIDEKN